MDYTKLLYEGKDIEYNPNNANPEGVILRNQPNTYKDVVNAMKNYKKKIVKNKLHDFYGTLIFESTSSLAGKGTIYLSYTFSGCHREEHVLTECMHYEIIQYKSLEKKRQRKN